MPSDFETTIASFSFAKTLSHFMRANLRYASEEQRLLSRNFGYWWKTPEETFNDRFGFCYDLAAFALCGLEQSGLTEAKLLFVAWGEWGIESNSGHFVCFYCVGNSYYSIDNGVLKGPYSFNQLLLSASRSISISSYKIFSAIDIPFRMSYWDMRGFVDEAC